MYQEIEKCRICKRPDKMVDVIDLGEQKITSRFPIYGDTTTPSTPICLCLCENCGLLQLKHNISCTELYEHEYGYRSGINQTMRSHLKEYQQEVLTKLEMPIREGDVVLDIGSNDSTMLQYYPATMRRIGVDPTGKQFAEFYPPGIELLPEYFTKENVQRRFGADLKCRIISSISMFYDLPDPVQFAKDVYDLLCDDGIWTVEMSYLLSMFNTNSIDTICHEHLEYYSLTSIKAIFDQTGFTIVDVGFNECNGGSFRIYLAKTSTFDVAFETENPAVVAILEKETAMNIKSRECYLQFQHQCDVEIAKLVTFLRECKTAGKRVYIYGASTKGNCLLQYADIGENYIRYAVERNPKKIGKSTSTGVEIIGEEEMRRDPPEYLLVLPWHFQAEILERESEFIRNGGKIVFPFPRFSIHDVI